MPFGAEPDGAGCCRFRLWAPGARSVSLRLGEDSPRQLPMESLDEGWYELTTPAPEGTPYCYVIDELCVPDPASRGQQEDVHGPSLVVDPGAREWHDGSWKGRPWEEAVFYELHVGTFSPEGTFDGVRSRLDYLADLGVTAVELMPVADFPGRRNWGYDGVLPFAPDRAYGHPDELKALIEAAHERGLMVFLDVVYNHFGPEGNYLYLYAPAFFSKRHHTPWGAALNFDGEGSHWVREFFIENALYWLEEYHLDGLRLDAVHAIEDDSHPDILEELAARVRDHFGDDRHIHLVLENDRNQARYLGRDRFDAQWNDDIHHVFHVLTTDEETGYYADYAETPLDLLGRCLTEGFAYQGEWSRYREEPRGEHTDDLPATAFVSFLQNHDQVGNRAFGERLPQLSGEAALRAVTALLLLSPSPPLIFMGQEWATERPFPFFCDFGAELAPKVTQGRREEFARFPAFSDSEVRARIPDPVAKATFNAARLPWEELEQPAHSGWLGYFRELLHLRREHLTERLPGLQRRGSGYRLLGENGLVVHWTFRDGGRWLLLGNLGPEPISDLRLPQGRRVFMFPTSSAQWQQWLPPWGVLVLYQEPGHRDEPRFDT